MAEDLRNQLWGAERSALLSSLVASGRIGPGKLSLSLSRKALASQLGLPRETINKQALGIESHFTLRRRGVEAKLILGERSPNLDRTMIKTIAQGWAWFEEIKNGTTTAAIAKRHKITQRRVAHLVDLAFLAPDLVQAVTEGNQSPDLTADKIIKSKHRISWADQRSYFSAL